MALTIRSGRPSNVPSVLLLWAQSDAKPTHTDDTASLSALVTHDPGALIVAENGGSIVGSVIAGWDGWRGSIYRLVVAPSHRRMGLGRRLVAEAEFRLEAKGATRLQAVVVDTDEVAMDFWLASGWEEQVHRRRFVKG